MLSGSLHHPIFFQVLQKICLAIHVKSMAELLHTDAIQQLEVALLGSKVAQVITLLTAGGVQLTLASKENVILPPKAYTSTPMAPPPSTVPNVGVTCSLPVASVSVDGSEVTGSDSQEITPSSTVIPKHFRIAPTHLLAVPPPPVYPASQPHIIL